MERIYTPEEVAKILSLDIRTVYSYIRRGDLAAAKFGRVYRVTENQLTNFISLRAESDSTRVLRTELDKIVRQLKENYDPEKIILFGSMAHGKSDSHDIDLLIIKKTEKDFFDRLKDVLSICSYDQPVDFLVYTPEEFETEVRENPFVRVEIAQKGKVIYDKAA